MRIFWLILSCSLLAALAFVVWPAGGGPESPVSPAPGPANAAVPSDASPKARTGPEPLAPSAAKSSGANPELTDALLAGPKSIPASPPGKLGVAAEPHPAAPSTIAGAVSSQDSPLPSSAGTAPEAKPADPADTKLPSGAPQTAGAASPTGEATATATPGTAATPTSPSTSPQEAPPAPSSSPVGTSAGAAAPAATLSSTPIELPAQSNFPPEKIVAAKAERRSDGATLLDGRFVVKGSGTQADPYVVPWDLLVSAQETYKPRLGMTKLPQRVTMLDNKYVKIEGFIAFPITAASPREALVMLNQWDGCCIGTPPTPYDAIEVKLTLPASAGQKLMTSGGIMGRFRVDPYEDGGWLLGLFLMEDGKLFGNEGL